MVIGYESDARKDRRRVEDPQKESIDLKAKLDEAEGKHAAELERALALEAVRKKLKERHD